VDYRLLKDDFVKGKLGTKKRDYLQASDDAVHMGKGNLGGGLATVNSNIAHIGLKPQWRSMNTAYFDAATGNALQFCEEAVLT
jgi:hypothetical protein